MVKPAIPAAAATIITAGETIFASTAACPTTRAPMMDTLWPMVDVYKRQLLAESLLMSFPGPT